MEGRVYKPFLTSKLVIMRFSAKDLTQQEMDDAVTSWHPRSHNC